MQERNQNAVQCPKCGMWISKALAKCPQDGTPLLASPVGIFADRYEFLEALGAGGMSVIYKARQRVLNRIVAIKMMHEHLMSPQTVRRFQQEGQAASSLDHPNIVKVHDFGLTDAGQPYMVMDLVEGKSLSQVLEELGELPVPQCLIIFLDICDALIHAHDKGILHRDLKPSNIMLTTTFDRPMQAKLVDFGIAKLMDDEADSPMQKLTQTGELFGSPLYMSPEQCYGKKVDRRSDIYSFGCLMFECLTGDVPIRGDRLVDTITRQMTAKAPLLSQARPDKTYPPRLEEVLDKCLAKNPDARYKNFEEVRAELFSIQHDLDDGLQRDKRVGRHLLRAISEWKVAALLVLCSLLILCGVGYGVSALRNSHASERKKLALEKAKFLPLLQKQFVTTAILGDCLSENSGLTKIDLKDTPVNDDGMIYLNLQTDLKDLYLEDTNVGDKGLKRLTNLKRLQTLVLRGTQITSDGLTVMSNFPELRCLDLYNTAITADGLVKLKPLKALTQLNIGKTSITGPCLDVLNQLPIKTLTLTSSGLGAIDLRSIEGFKKLKRLEFANTGMDDSGISHLVGLPELEELNINQSAFGDGCPQYLVKMKHLKRLDISNTKLTDRGLTELAKAANLEDLQVRYLKIDWAKTVGVLKNLHHLISLDVSYNDLDDAAIEQIAQIKTLRYLNISTGYDNRDHSKMTSKSAAAIARELPDLRELRMSGNTKMNDVASLNELVKLQKLTYLEMDDVNVHDDKANNIRLLHQRLPKCVIKNDERD